MQHVHVIQAFMDQHVTINQCLNGVNPCNNGSCIPVQNGLLSYTCQCFPGFTGIFDSIVF